MGAPWTPSEKLRAPEPGMVKNGKTEGPRGKTQSSGATSPPGLRVSAPGDPGCSQAGPDPSWLLQPRGWWGCSGWEASAWAPSAASGRWPGGWCSSEELLWGLPQDPERLCGVRMRNQLVPGARAGGSSVQILAVEMEARPGTEGDPPLCHPHHQAEQGDGPEGLLPLL